MAIREVDTRFAELRSELKRVVDDGIREGKTEKTVIASVKAVLKKLNKRLATRLNSEVELLADEIDELGEGLKDRILMYFQVSAPSGKDDLDGLGEAIKTDWSDIARQIRQILLDVAEAILAFFMGKVVGLIVAVVKAAKWIWRLFSRNRQTRQREARQRAHKKVDELVNKAYSQVKERLNRQLRRLKSKINRTLDQSAGIMVDYGNFGTTVARHVMALAVAQGQLCTIAAEVASNEAAKCCYFDVDQQRATVIGNVGSVDLRQELGMSEVETWPSLKKWLKAKGHKMSDSTLRLVSPDDYERQCARAFAPRMRVTTIEVCDQ
jgi:hypothetical protein